MYMEDDELVREILLGNRCALDVLVNRYYEIIYSYTMRQVNEYHLACDLVQEVFIKMMKNIHKYKGGSNKFKYWLLTITINHIRDYYRLQKNNRASVMTEFDQLPQREADNMINLLELKEERQVIVEALNNLKEEEKEIIILKYYNDLTIKQISGITGDNESTIKSRLYRGISKLGKFLSGGGEFEKRVNGR
jgi:RNA polymerase sigma factor (sigma-70 family)